MTRISVLTYAVCLTSVGCFPSLSLDNRPCPCADGWSCDEDLMLCVQGRANVCGLALEASDIDLVAFEASWRTDSAIEWRWDVADELRSEIERYELVLGLSEESARTRVGADILGGADYPELQRPTLPDTGGNDDVDKTIARDLTSDTSYFARLVVYDRMGQVACSPIVQASTWPRHENQLVLYDEEPFASSQPPCVQHTNDSRAASSGAFYAGYRQRCMFDDAGIARATCDESTESAPSCFENIRLQRRQSSPTLTSGEFEQGAQLQIDIAIDESRAGFYSELGLAVLPADPTPDDPMPFPTTGIFIGRPLTIVADGLYRTYTAPLSTLGRRCDFAQGRHDDARSDAGLPRLCGEPLRVEDLTADIQRVRVGTTLEHGAVMRIDRAVLRW